MLLSYLPLIILMGLTLFAIAYVAGKPLLVKKRRVRIANQPFPKSWRKILQQKIPYFYSMPTDLQLQLKKHILVFLDEKKFYGFKGITINDEIRVTIAAQACLLLLNRDTDYYPKLKSVYVYPAAFIAKNTGVDNAGVLKNHHRILSGESWDIGKVILSWRDSEKGAQDFSDGHNVVIHEFAHQLDQETGVANGAPFLKSKNNNQWSKVLSREFEMLTIKARKGEDALLDHYGATNPAEFFAVASEVFFEKPKEMLKMHEQLYLQLQAFYQVNPAIW